MATLIPQKKFSQNFLVNTGMQSKIYQTFADFLVSLSPSEKLIEIGPGRGDMTAHLLKIGQPILCLELDPQAIDFLQEQDFIKNAPINIELRLTDALEQLELANNPLLPDSFNLFSSLPYSTGSRMLVAMGINYPAASYGVIVQREVAQKSILTDKKVTLFGIWLNLIWDTKLVFNIAPGNFYPAPKVMSSFLTGKAKETLPEFLQTTAQRQKVLNLLHKLVAQPNKTLANNLKSILPNTQSVTNFLEDLGLDPKVRLKHDNYYLVLEQLTKKGY